MIVTVSKRQRRLLVHVSRGDDLIEALEDLAHKHELRAAWVRGVGTLECAELEHARIDEPCEILSLEGALRWDDVDPVFRLRATLTPLAGGGVVTGGVLVKAAAIDVNLFVECFDDVPVEEVRAGPRIEAQPSDPVEPAARPSSRDWVEEAPAARKEPSSRGKAPPQSRTPQSDRPQSNTPAAGPVGWGAVMAASEANESSDEGSEETKANVSWAAVAQASARAEEPDAEEDLGADFDAAFSPASPRRASKPAPAPRHKPPPMPQKRSPNPKTAAVVQELMPSKGDFVQHRQFGLCKIEKADGRGAIVIKLKSGVRKTIRLDYMEIGRARDERGRKVYPIRPRKR